MKKNDGEKIIEREKVVERGGFFSKLLCLILIVCVGYLHIKRLCLILMENMLPIDLHTPMSMDFAC